MNLKKLLLAFVPVLTVGALVAPTAAHGTTTCAPALVAHRGGTETHVENTRNAFKDAIAKGASWLETDIQFTSDNVPVIMHDDTVDRTTNGTGAVNDLTLAQLRAFRTSDNQYVPTLYEFLTDQKAGGVKAFVELKTTPTAAQWSTFDARFDWLDMQSQVVITSFDKTLLPTVKDHGYTAGWIDGLGDRDPAEVTPYATYYLKHQWSITYDRVQKWKAAGLKVFPWTPDDSATWLRFKQAGVSGTLTNDPGEYKTWAAAQC